MAFISRHDGKGNDELNFNQKLKVLQTKLDMWSSRDLTLWKSYVNQNPRDISANLFRIKQVSFLPSTNSRKRASASREHEDVCKYLNVLQRFNSTNECQITPTKEEILIGVLSNSHDKKTTGKFNYTILFTCHYFCCGSIFELAQFYF